MRKVGLMVGLALVAFACSETVGGVMQDAGDMLADAGDAMRDAGDMMQPDAGAQDTPASCNKSEEIAEDFVAHWAEFPIEPGQTEITVCMEANPGSYGPFKQGYCWRSSANWIRGTSTGFVTCGDTYQGERRNKPTSITVHN